MSGLPRKNHKNIWFTSNTGPDPLKWTPHPSVMMDEGHYISKPEASMYYIAI